MFGREGYDLMPTIDLPNDNHRINEIMELSDNGYLNQILISQDIAWKSRLRAYGGHGYDQYSNQRGSSDACKRHARGADPYNIGGKS